MGCSLADGFNQLVACIGFNLSYTRVGVPTYDVTTGAAVGSSSTLTVRGFWASARTAFNRQVRQGNRMLVVPANYFAGVYPKPGDVLDTEGMQFRVVRVQEDVPQSPAYALEVEKA